jgi:maltooligosyltrehalose trehalohydrolase
MVKNIDIHKRQIGVNFNAQHAEVWVWSPFATQVTLKLKASDLKLDLQPQSYGYWYLETDQLKAGQAYQYELTIDGETQLKTDPASLLQLDGVHGASNIVDLKAYPFKDRQWKGIPLANYLIYELHVGTFTADGNFKAIEERLQHLLALGITAIELMPVAAFSGDRNWGYDGVFPFTVHAGYGGPNELQRLVDACHQKGLAVILDVVYNHLGPEGNALPAFGPYFTDKYHTPWGEAINFDDAYCDGVRHYFIENMLMWFRDFHIDALRLDAVHAIKDFSAKHILAEMKTYVDELNAATGKKHYLLVECDLNDRKYLDDNEKGGYGMDAQWTDEFHHALRVAAGQQKTGYYADFNGVGDLAKAYQDAYVYDGRYSEERKKTFGNKVLHHPGEQFIVFSQNHDQVGNRMLGERSSALYSFEMQKLLAGAVLVSPYIPLFFMGEEWGASQPFLYFVNHSEADLIKAVREGRANEFKAFHQDGEVPDPQDELTFLRSKLNWESLQEIQHQQLFEYYRSLIALRKSNPVLNQLDRKQLQASALEEQNCLVLYRWHQADKILCFLNFSEEVQSLNFGDAHHWEKVFDSSAPIFGGQAESTFEPEKELLNLQPESIILFANKHV